MCSCGSDILTSVTVPSKGSSGESQLYKYYEGRRCIKATCCFTCKSPSYWFTFEFNWILQLFIPESKWKSLVQRHSSNLFQYEFICYTSFLQKSEIFLDPDAELHLILSCFKILELHPSIRSLILPYSTACLDLGGSMPSNVGQISWWPQARYHILSHWRFLGLLQVEHAWNTSRGTHPGGVLIRCTYHLSWALQLTRVPFFLQEWISCQCVWSRAVLMFVFPTWQ